LTEPVDDSGAFRDSVFYTTTGTAYVGAALRAAREADPAAKLYINDYNLEYPGAKQDTEFELVQSVLAEGAPLDGVGFQGHLIVGSVPPVSTLVASLERFADLGLEVAYTELDIRLTLPATEESLAQQKADYEAVIESCLQVEACVGVTIWDYTDKVSSLTLMGVIRF
jgi:endo-1,4-beta-xylanase